MLMSFHSGILHMCMVSNSKRLTGRQVSGFKGFTELEALGVQKGAVMVVGCHNRSGGGVPIRNITTIGEARMSKLAIWILRSLNLPAPSVVGDFQLCMAYKDRVSG